MKLREEAEIDTGKIKDNEKISQDSKDKILEFYEIATGASLAGSFDTRKKELADSVKLWYGTLAWSTFVLFASVVGIYLTSFYGGFVGINIFLPRILLTSPLIFFTAFATQRYTHERNILERYAFKSATASALESYTKLLKNTFKSSEAEKRILDFVVDSMTVIYKEPFDTKNESKISLGINPKSGDIKGEITETKEAIESVKKIVTTQEEGI